MQGTVAREREMWETTHSESLSDIDDAEVDSYINNEKEKHYKKIIWEKINHNYLQEQEAMKTYANAAKPKKDSRQKRTTGVKKSQSTAGKTDPTSSNKRCSSRLNYDAAAKMLGESVPSDSSKKRKTESPSDQNAGENLIGAQVGDDGLSAAGEDDEENDWEEEEEEEEPQDYPFYSNQDDDYNCYDDGDEY